MGAFTSDFRPKIFSRRVEEGPVRESRRIEKKRVEYLPRAHSPVWSAVGSMLPNSSSQ